MLYYVFSGPLSLRAYVPEIKFNNNKKIYIYSALYTIVWQVCIFKSILWLN